MRQFTYFLYDCYDPEEVKNPADNPRLVLNAGADQVLTAVIDASGRTCQYDTLCRRFSKEHINSLLHIGLLRANGDLISPGCPVFTKENSEHLSSCFSEYVSRMADSLIQHKTAFYQLAGKLENGFSPEVNLYHILCGAILDGDLFGVLSDNGVVTTSHVHPSGLDYLIIAYENCPELDKLSKKLLCSYNRFTDGKRALQSFGDADGDRVDFFRFSMQKRKGTVPEHLKHIEQLWDQLEARDHRQLILNEVQRLVETGECTEPVKNLLSEFGYLRNGEIAVPVYTTSHTSIIQQMEQLTEQCILKEMETALTAPNVLLPLQCLENGVPVGETANELYHLVFGQLNEVLVKKGFAAKPEVRPNEGRCLKSIELMNL